MTNIQTVYLFSVEYLHFISVSSISYFSFVRGRSNFTLVFTLHSLGNKNLPIKTGYIVCGNKRPLNRIRFLVLSAVHQNVERSNIHRLYHPPRRKKN
jgi:hypothetical protein